MKYIIKPIVILIFLLLTIAFIPINTVNVHAESSNTELIKYEGKVFHIFFHSLIINPELAFNSPKAEGYNDWMTTKDEFLEILPLLYRNDFILIDIASLIIKDTNGSIKKADLYLPKGKKPLIISLDDVNYYQYMKGHGFAEKLIQDKNGEITTCVNNNGRMTTSSNGDIIPIIDHFVSIHPDFSFKGAKGIIAVTGYEGVFGYRTTSLSGDELVKATKEATQIAKQLKATGWRIASHSYSHSGKFRDSNITLDQLKNDTNKWKSQIEPIVGNTSIYISPFGMPLKATDERMKYLNLQGYYIYCPVGKDMNLNYSSNVMIEERLNFDGYSYLKDPKRIKKYFFDPAIFIDAQRP